MRIHESFKNGLQIALESFQSGLRIIENHQELPQNHFRVVWESLRISIVGDSRLSLFVINIIEMGLNNWGSDFVCGIEETGF